MKKNFILLYVLLVAAQMLICNYLHLTSYVQLSLLPALILCLPTRVRTSVALLIAFATGMAVDLIAEGAPGINTVALLPVALLRRTVCDFIFGEELVLREEEFSIRKYGLPKVLFALFLVQALFLLIYLWADGAGTRPFLFNLIRFGASLAAGMLLGIPVTDMLTPDDRK
ncbi:MAG: hypothetical protein IJ255_05250 [Bacteroidales bacterium]|nr:hypothetical protein [Bacteroidales bacterium]